MPRLALIPTHRNRFLSLKNTILNNRSIGWCCIGLHILARTYPSIQLFLPSDFVVEYSTSLVI